MLHRTHEQYYAELLYATLQKELDAEIKITGSGVHWDVLVTSPQHSCIIHCFHYDSRDYKGPEFYVLLFTNGNRKATGRSRSLEETIAIVGQWIKGASLSKLYRDHAFLDSEKRQLEQVEALLLYYCPSLRQTTYEVKEGDFITYSLLFSKEERSCEIKTGGNEVLICDFCWDDTTIFKTTEPASETLAGLVGDWVAGKSMPSVFQQRYPDLSFGIIAEYYEKGKGIEGEFLDSWDHVRMFARWHPYYEKEMHPLIDKLVTLIYVMRDKGFDHLLRAGQSMTTLVLSRSRRHGLRSEQARLCISIENGPLTMTVHNAEESYTFEKIEYNDTLDRLLRQLASQPID